MSLMNGVILHQQFSPVFHTSTRVFAFTLTSSRLSKSEEKASIPHTSPHAPSTDLMWRSPADVTQHDAVFSTPQQTAAVWLVSCWHADFHERMLVFVCVAVWYGSYTDCVVGDQTHLGHRRDRRHCFDSSRGAVVTQRLPF
jgi:hypothetical protein